MQLNFSAILSHCSHISVHLLSYGSRSTPIWLERRKNMDGINTCYHTSFMGQNLFHESIIWFLPCSLRTSERRSGTRRPCLHRHGREPGRCHQILERRRRRKIVLLISLKKTFSNLCKQVNFCSMNVATIGAVAYQLGNTSSRTISEVKQRWARLVFGWETSSVSWVLLVTLKSQLDLISHPILVVGSVLMQS